MQVTGVGELADPVLAAWAAYVVCRSFGFEHSELALRAREVVPGEAIVLLVLCSRGRTLTYGPAGCLPATEASVTCERLYAALGAGTIAKDEATAAWQASRFARHPTAVTMLIESLMGSGVIVPNPSDS
jgi:hypothetical protein